MERNNELRGLIYSKYPSIAECARALGWTRQKLTTIINGGKMPDLAEAARMAQVLGFTLSDLAKFFLPQ